jgi:hypothetical protein
MDESVNKGGQLTVVALGFFVTVAFLIMEVGSGALSTRILLTLIVALAFAVRYWWAVLVLPWPFQWFRLVLMLFAWTLLPLVASSVGNSQHWVLVLAALSAVGFVTEVFGWVSEQWRVGSPEMTRSLKRQHAVGAAAAGVAAIILLTSARVWTSPALEWLVLAIAAADWVRLVVMIRRYERMSTTRAAA